MFDPFGSHFSRIEIGITAVEARISVDHFEIVCRYDLYLVVRRDISKTHILAIPLQFTMQPVQAGEAHSQYTHHDHFIERTGELEIRRGFRPVRSRFLTSANPVLFMCIRIPYIAIAAFDTRYGRFGLVEILHGRER